MCFLHALASTARENMTRCLEPAKFEHLQNRDNFVLDEDGFLHIPFVRVQAPPAGFDPMLNACLELPNHPIADSEEAKTYQTRMEASLPNFYYVSGVRGKWFITKRCSERKCVDESGYSCAKKSCESEVYAQVFYFEMDPDKLAAKGPVSMAHNARFTRNMYRFRLVTRLVARLVIMHKASVHRLFRPGGQGFESAKRSYKQASLEYSRDTA